MTKRILLILLAIAIIGLNYMRYGKQPEPYDHTSDSYHMLQRGKLEVVFEDIKLVDTSRPTAPSGRFPGSAQRSLLTRIWQPEQLHVAAPRKPAPLLIYNHGFLSSRVGGTYLARHLASYGYIVAAADFPLTNMESPGPQQAQDVLNQPADVSFVIDQLLALNSDPASSLYGAIDPQKIATAGMSLGGMTASLLAFHPALWDLRVRAAISIAGPNHLFTKKFYSFRDVPFMMVASPIDAVIDYQTNARPVLDKITRAVLVTIDTASHTGYSFQARALRWVDNPDRVGCWAILRKRRDETPWGHLVGTPEQGIEHNRLVGPCHEQELPTAMNPIQQQRLTALATTSFLQSLFADDAAERERHRQFLYQQLADENAQITVEATAAMTP